jgi:hypothetical protein
LGLGMVGGATDISGRMGIMSMAAHYKEPSRQLRIWVRTPDRDTRTVRYQTVTAGAANRRICRAILVHSRQREPAPECYRMVTDWPFVKPSALVRKLKTSLTI